MILTVDVPAGEFSACVEVLETTPLDPKEESAKIYRAGIGLVIDDVVQLTTFGPS
jgi:hypothetical protein